MLKHFIIYILLVSLQVVCKAQQSIPVSDLINMIETNYGNESNDEILDYLERQKKNVSAIEKIEFRTETDRWDIGRQDYTFRTSLNSKAERVGEKKEIDNHKQLISKEGHKVELEKRYDIYRELLDIYFLQRERNMLVNELVIAEDELTILKLKAQNGVNIDPADYIKAEIDISNIVMKRESREREKEEKKRYVLPEIHSNSVIDFNSWMTVEEVLLIAENRLSKQMKVSVDEEIQLIKQEQAKIALHNEVAEKDRVIDFVQLQYSGNNNQISGEQLSFGVGLVLPSKQINRRNIREATIDLHRETWQLKLQEEETRQEQRKLRRSFELCKSEYLEIKNQYDELDIEGKLNILKEQESVEPKSLLDLKNIQLGQEESMLEKEKEIFEDILKMYFLYGWYKEDATMGIFEKRIEKK